MVPTIIPPPTYNPPKKKWAHFDLSVVLQSLYYSFIIEYLSSKIATTVVHSTIKSNLFFQILHEIIQYIYRWVMFGYGWIISNYFTNIILVPQKQRFFMLFSFGIIKRTVDLPYQQRLSPRPKYPPPTRWDSDRGRCRHLY